MELLVADLLKSGIQRTDQFNPSMFCMGGLIYYLNIFLYVLADTTISCEYEETFNFFY
jgi:hypothetical protein